MNTSSSSSVCANTAWVIETGVGSSNSTVNPPSPPWMRITTNADQASTRTHRRRSRRCTTSAWITTSSPTAAAAMRWPCSYRMPPTMGGNSMP